METTILYLDFIDDETKTFTISIEEPKQSLTETEIKNAMNEILSKNIFHKNIIAAKGARIVRREVDYIDVE